MMKHSKGKLFALVLTVFAFVVLGAAVASGNIGINSVTPAFAQTSWEDQLDAHVNPMISLSANGRSTLLTLTPVRDDTPGPPAAGGRLPSQIEVLHSSEEQDGFTSLITFTHFPGTWGNISVVVGSANDEVETYTYKVRLIYKDDSGAVLATHDITAGSFSVKEAAGSPWSKDLLLDALNPIAFSRSGAGNQGVRVRWTDTKKVQAQPDAALGALPSKYQVLRSPAAGYVPSGDITSIDTTPNGKYIKFDDVTAYPGTTYTYMIRVFYPNGHRETITLDMKGIASLRMNLNESATRGADNSVTVTWDAAKWGPSEYQVRRFKVTQRPNGKYAVSKADLAKVSHVEGAEHTYTDTTATDSSARYFYQIRAASPSGKTARTGRIEVQ